LAASILPIFFATVTSQLLETAPRLHQALFPLQRIQIGANLGRVATLVLTLPWWPSAVIASLCAAIPQLWGNWALRHLSAQYAESRAAPDPEARRRILEQVRRTLPAVIYYTTSGQLAIWLTSIFGRTDSVAAIGALGRLAMIL